MRKNFTVWSLALLALLSGCGILGIGEDGERERLARSMRTWSENQPERYHFVLERLCLCPLEVVSAVEIGVGNGVVVSRRYVQTGQPVSARYVELFPSMEGVFDLLEDALDREAGRIDVRYDSRYGFPFDATIDYVLNAVDDELSFRVRAFTTD